MGIAVAYKAKFMLKGTAVTSIIILLILPSLLIFRLSFATSYPESAAPLSLSSPYLVSNCHTCDLVVGREFIIMTEITNREQLERPVVVITQVYDSEDIIESIGIVSGIVNASGAIKVGVSWTPQHPGNYKLKSFAISDFESPTILANPNESKFTVPPADFPYVRIDALYVAPGYNPFEAISNYTIKVGKPYSVTTEITRLKAPNFGNENALKYVLDIEIRDKEGRVIASSWSSGILPVGKSATGGIYWTPTVTGNYTIQSVVLGNFVGTPLSRRQSVDITVIQ